MSLRSSACKLEDLLPVKICRPPCFYIVGGPLAGSAGRFWWGNGPSKCPLPGPKLDSLRARALFATTAWSLTGTVKTLYFPLAIVFAPYSSGNRRGGRCGAYVKRNHAIITKMGAIAPFAFLNLLSFQVSR